MGKYIHETAEVFDVDLAEDAKIYKFAFVKKTRIGVNTKVGDFSRVESSEFGSNIEIQRNSMIYNSEMGDYSYTGRNFTCWFAKIGKFCSISWNVSIGGANHDYNRITQHAFLYAKQFGMIDDENTIGYNRFESECSVGNDVWIGCNAVICRNVKIGDGAVIAAGAVVTKDVPPYTIVGGCPAKFIKRRCSEDLAERIQKTRWWNFDPQLIKSHFELFNSKITEESVFHLEQMAKESKTNI